MEGLHLAFVLVLWMLPLGLNATVTPEQLTHSTSSRNDEVILTDQTKSFTLDQQNHTLKSSQNPEATIELSTQTWISDNHSRPLIQTRPGTTIPGMESYFNISTKTIQPNTTKDQSGVTSVVVVRGQDLKRDSSTTATEDPFSYTPSQVSILEMTTTSTKSIDEQPTDQPAATTSDSTDPGSTVMSETNPTTPTTVSKAVDMTTSTKGLITQVVNTDMTVIVSTTTAVTTKREPIDRPTKATNQKKPKEAGKHGTVVAVLIGGSIIIMMLGFVVIFIRKRRRQRKQMMNTEWAGPSPFLDGVVDDDDNGQVHLRGSQRISLAGFLPQRLSTRLSLLREKNTDYNMEDIPQSTFGRELSAGQVEPSNETNLGAKEIKDQESPISISPTIPSTDHDSDPKTPATTEDTASNSDHLVVHPLSPPKDSLPLMDVDLSPHPDAIPSVPNTAGAIVPPAPPLLMSTYELS
ncbi:protein EVI2B [Hypomesus transpacificus]|uniref:protein EVI2B n=1 Tax=Hypomesus transpacificus TaxID=137520 RepID=UPI001F0737F7|nr:protein EVI2B [Hypomesus transpacificus]